MQEVMHYEGRQVRIRYSIGGAVPYVESWEDNVLAAPGVGEWPASLLRQVNSYVARADWFSKEDAAALAAGLGRISKFQSLNSEDAVTWSWFGTLGSAEPQARRRAVQWLYDHLELGLRASRYVRIDQWMRVVHPNVPESPRGPELDARIDDPGVALIYVEAKWDAPLGTGRGSSPDRRDDQIVLRRDALRVDPALADDSREFVVLGISNKQPDLGLYSETAHRSSLRAVRIKWLTWSELAGCDAHPLAEEFRRYLEWKRGLARPTGRRELSKTPRR